MKDLVDTSMIYSCVCANVRRTDLVVSQFYDGVLAPSGLYALQFGLLSAIAKLAPITINRLAEVMDMDRATINRHLKMLTDEDWIRYEEGEERGTSQVLLTQEGEQVLGCARPLWQEAQDRIEHAFGHERFTVLLGELAAIRTALSSGAA